MEAVHRAEEPGFRVRAGFAEAGPNVRARLAPVVYIPGNAAVSR
jgi:hypothetical protein